MKPHLTIITITLWLAWFSIDSMAALSLLGALVPAILGMGWYGPGCCCDIFSDDFNRSDSSDVGSDWDEVSGDWAIASNVLSISDADAIIKCVYPRSCPGQFVDVTVTGSDVTDKIRVLVDYVDANNYHAVELLNNADGHSQIKIFKVTSGSETQLNDNNARTGDWESVTPGGPSKQIFACAHDDQITVFAKSPGTSTTHIHDRVCSTLHGGLYVGLATGDTVSGTVTFNSFDYRHHGDQQYGEPSAKGCGYCYTPCEHCDDMTSPEEIQINFDGVANADCTDCGDFNSTSFILHRRCYNTTDDVNYCCRWDCFDSIPCSGATQPLVQINLQLSDAIPANDVAELLVVRDDPAPFVQNDVKMRATFDSFPLDCEVDLDDVVLSYLSSDNYTCDWSSASALISNPVSCPEL